jgi:23S rRNA (adenine2503-C2)-methyltransferase
MDLHPVARLPDEWTEALARRGERAFRAKEVFRWIHHKGALEPAEMTSLPRPLREALLDEFGPPLVRVERVHRSTDGTRKLLLRLRDDAAIETVLLPGVSGGGSVSADAAVAADDEEDEPAAAREGAASPVRVTQCISTQVGCAMGCVFCASGVAGLKRHLRPEEIVAQVILGRALCEPGEELRNVVLMGMGEPLHNYDATMKALRILADEHGLAVSPRRVTLSTVGVLPALDRLATEPVMPNLAISLHSTTEEQRDLLVPINRKYGIEELLEACRRFPLKRRDRITFEYVMLKDVNDRPDDARRLVRLLSGIKAKVNLLPLNEAAGIPFERPSDAAVNRFAKILAERGVTVSVRKSRGRDIRAACGQLITESSRKAAPGRQLAALMAPSR